MNFHYVKTQKTTSVLKEYDIANAQETIDSTTYIDDLLKLFEIALTNITQSPMYSLWIVSTQDHDLKISEINKTQSGYLNEALAQIKQDIAQKIIKNPQEIYIINDIQWENISDMHLNASKSDIISMVGIPLYHEKNLIGILNCLIINYHNIAQKEINSLAQIAAQTIIVLNKMQ